MAADRENPTPLRPHAPRRSSSRTRKIGPMALAVEQAIQDELHGLPPAEILMRLQTAGLDADTAQMVYNRVREQVAPFRQRALWWTTITGATVLATSLSLLLLMTCAWPAPGRLWWVLVTALAVLGLTLILIAQRGQRQLESDK